MASKLAPNKELTREVNLRGLSAPVNITITTEGITIAPKRSRKPLTISWLTVIDNMTLPPDIPAKFYQEPLRYLESQLGKSASKSKTLGYVGVLPLPRPLGW